MWKDNGGIDCSATYACDNGIHARIVLQPLDSSNRWGTIADAIAEKVNLLPYVGLIGGTSMGSGHQAALEIRERSVADLHAHLSKLSDLMSDLTKREVDSRRALVAEHEALYIERRQKLEAEHEARVVEMEARERALQERQKDFDSREAKLLRRKNQDRLEDFLNSLKGSSGDISDEARKKRKPIFWAIVAMAIVFSMIAAFSGWHYFTTLDLHYLIPFATSLAALSATAVYFLRWSDRWFRMHAENEMQARRYRADMLRAAWVAEFVQECVADGKEAPRELVEVFARSLFQTQGQYGEVEHPIEQVLGLLKRANKIDIGKGRIAIESDPAKRPES